MMVGDPWRSAMIGKSDKASVPSKTWRVIGGGRDG